MFLKVQFLKLPLIGVEPYIILRNKNWSNMTISLFYDQGAFCVGFCLIFISVFNLSFSANHSLAHNQSLYYYQQKKIFLANSRPRNMRWLWYVSATKHLGIGWLVCQFRHKFQKSLETLVGQLYRLWKGVSAEAAHETTVQSRVTYIYGRFFPAKIYFCGRM